MKYISIGALLSAIAKRDLSMIVEMYLALSFGQDKYFEAVIKFNNLVERLESKHGIKVLSFGKVILGCDELDKGIKGIGDTMDVSWVGEERMSLLYIHDVRSACAVFLLNLVAQTMFAEADKRYSSDYYKQKFFGLLIDKLKESLKKECSQ